MSNGVLQRFYPSELGDFLRCWLADPRAVGAVAPSGKALARLMTRDLYPGARVVELGPGTGTLTVAILERGVGEEGLVMIEQSAEFVKVLARRFPASTIVRGDATKPNVALAPLKGSIDFIVSGLPLVLFSNEQKRDLLRHSFDLLAARGALYQFTYGGRCPIGRRVLAELGLVAKRIGMAALNVPPAFVYRIARAG